MQGALAKETVNSTVQQKVLAEQARKDEVAKVVALESIVAEEATTAKVKSEEDRRTRMQI